MGCVPRVVGDLGKKSELRPLQCGHRWGFAFYSFVTCLFLLKVVSFSIFLYSVYSVTYSVRILVYSRAHLRNRFLRWIHTEMYGIRHVWIVFATILVHRSHRIHHARQYTQEYTQNTSRIQAEYTYTARIPCVFTQIHSKRVGFARARLPGSTGTASLLDVLAKILATPQYLC